MSQHFKIDAISSSLSLVFKMFSSVRNLRTYNITDILFFENIAEFFDFTSFSHCQMKFGIF